MSEKELREFAKETAGQYAPPGVRDLCKSLLADDPDVVAGLRHIEDNYRLALIDLRFARRDRATVDEGYARAHERARVWKLLRRWWRKHFHVRLTDGGYEWVEEEDNAEDSEG